MNAVEIFDDIRAFMMQFNSDTNFKVEFIIVVSK